MAPVKVFCISECALCERGSSRLLLFRIFFHPLKMSVLPGPCLRSSSLPVLLLYLTSSGSDSVLANPTFTYRGQVSSGFQIHISM